jgi:AraC-like DNA-binding protein
MNIKKYSIPGGRKVIALPSAAEIGRLRHFRPYVRQSDDDWRPHWQIRDRKLLDFLIVFIGKGHGIFTVGGRTFKVNTDDIVWIPPDTAHEMSGTSERMNCIYIHFDLVYDPERSHWDACIPGGTNDFPDCAGLMHPKVDDPVVRKWRGLMAVENKMLVKKLMKQICIEHKRSGERAFLLLSGLILQLISVLISESQKSDYFENIRWKEIENSAEKIRLSGEGRMNIGELARSCRLSLSHFRKLFREIHGVSPMFMHNQARLQKACEMLVYSKMNVSEIASSLGYSNVHNFSRSFSRMMKVSPKNYRKGVVYSTRVKN